jgi:enoyl-CoA hydratase/carnithine racemase
MSFTTFQTAKKDGVLTVTLDHGEVNIMSAQMARELFALVGQLSTDRETKVVILESANPEFFIAHFDIHDIVRLLEGDPSIPVSKSGDINVLQALVLSIQSLPQVTIAKVDGIVRGGGFELLLALDMIFATEDSKFCFPEASGGFLPGGGGSTLLPLRIGRPKAMEILVTSRDFSGQEAAEYGVVNRVFADAPSLNDYVAETARQIAKKNLSCIQAIKAVNRKVVSAFVDGLLAGLAQENESMKSLLSSPEVFEKLKRFADMSGTRDVEPDLANKLLSE